MDIKKNIYGQLANIWAVPFLHRLGGACSFKRPYKKVYLNILKFLFKNTFKI